MSSSAPRGDVVPTSSQRNIMSELHDHDSAPKKRSRTAVACKRCKSRKQKCDGSQPTCGNCANSSSNCEYGLPQSSATKKAERYARAVQRVDELEQILAREGILESQAGGKWQPEYPVGTVSPTCHEDNLLWC
jgi:hypothetical protein